MWKLVTSHALVFVIGIGAAISTYLVMQARLEREVAVAKTQQLQKTIDQAADDMAKRQTEYEQRIAKLESAASAAKTTHDVAVALSRPDQTSLLSFNPFKVDEAPKGATPTAPEVTVPQEQIVPLYKRLLECQGTNAALEKCQADIKDTVAQRDAATEQAKTWEKSVRGTKASRLWFAFRVGGCGAIGTVPGLISHDSRATAAGAAITSSFCALTLRH